MADFLVFLYVMGIVSFVSFPIWYPGSGVVLDRIDSWFLPSSLLFNDIREFPEDFWIYTTVNSEIFARVLFSLNFAYAKFREIKSSRNAEITLSTTDMRKSYPSSEMFQSPVCLLTLFAKIKFSRKFPDLQYYAYLHSTQSFAKLIRWPKDNITVFELSNFVLFAQ